MNIGTLRIAKEKLSQDEIEKFNHFLNQTNTENALLQMENIKKSVRQYYLFWIVGVLLLGFGLYFFAGINILNIYSENRILGFIILFILLGIFIYSGPKGNIGKQDFILKNILGIIHENLKYEYYIPQIIDLEQLYVNDFLNSGGRRELNEKCIEISDKDYKIEGFEFKTSVRSSNFGNGYSNHCYLIKTVFKGKNFLSDDLKILAKVNFTSLDNNNEISPTFKKIMYIIFLIPILFIAFVFMLGVFINGNKILGLLMGAGLVLVIIGIFFITKQKNAKRKKFKYMKKENHIFNDSYDIFGKNPEEIRELLTNEFLDKIQDFTERTGNRYNFMFTENIFYIKRSIYGSYMEIDLPKSREKCLEMLIKIYVDFRETLKLIEYISSIRK